MLQDSLAISWKIAALLSVDRVDLTFFAEPGTLGF